MFSLVLLQAHLDEDTWLNQSRQAYLMNPLLIKHGLELQLKPTGVKQECWGRFNEKFNTIIIFSKNLSQNKTKMMLTKKTLKNAKFKSRVLVPRS